MHGQALSPAFPESFRYGPLPFEILFCAGAVLEKFGWQAGTSELYLLARSLTVLFDVLAIPLVFSIGRMLGDRRVGLAAAAFFTFLQALEQGWERTRPCDTLGVGPRRIFARGTPPTDWLYPFPQIRIYTRRP